ncbi:hypothetical protein ABQG65_08950 [Yersinia alsatica]|uniref:hypothetical protein n=1 Tax=Yersinia alsatica TaxID=2890317 RepID=UPI0032EB514F
MALQPKKWVFAELVKDPNDPEQLIAYAIYKADKDDHARQCRSRDMSEAQINQELERFHDGKAYLTRQLEDYRSKAKRTIDELVVSVSDGVALVYNNQLETLKKEHQQELDGFGKKWSDAALIYSTHLTTPHWGKKFLLGAGKWLAGGLAGLLATAITTIVIVGIVSFWQPNSRSVVRDGIKQGIDILVPDNPTPSFKGDKLPVKSYLEKDKVNSN